jgi:hypothetical protein
MDQPNRRRCKSNKRRSRTRQQSGTTTTAMTMGRPTYTSILKPQPTSSKHLSAAASHAKHHQVAKLASELRLAGLSLTLRVLSILLVSHVLRAARKAWRVWERVSEAGLACGYMTIAGQCWEVYDRRVRFASMVNLDGEVVGLDRCDRRGMGKLGTRWRKEWLVCRGWSLRCGLCSRQRLSVINQRCNFARRRIRPPYRLAIGLAV